MPTPTLLPVPPPLEGSAFAVFEASLSALIETSPPLAVICTAGSSSASVSVVAMLIATEPATPVCRRPRPKSTAR